MKLIKYDSPMPVMENLFDRLNWGFPTLDRFFTESDGKEDTWTAVRLPRTNIKETEDAYVFTMEMPGLKKSDVAVNMEGDTLVIKGEKAEEKTEKGVIRQEYRSTRFERTFNVTGIDRDKVKARMEDGVLAVTLPKLPEKVGKKIEIA